MKTFDFAQLIVALTLALLTGGVAHGEEAWPKTAEYLEGVRLCENYQSHFTQHAQDRLSEVGSSALEALTDPNLLHLFKMHQNTLKLIDNPDFQDGLADCFSGDELSQNLFLTSLVLADWGGKVAAIATVGGGAKLALRARSLLLKAGIGQAALRATRIAAMMGSVGTTIQSLKKARDARREEQRMIENDPLLAEIVAEAREGRIPKSQIAIEYRNRKFRASVESSARFNEEVAALLRAEIASQEQALRAKLEAASGPLERQKYEELLEELRLLEMQ